MPLEIIMIYINVTNFVLISLPEKDHSITETHLWKMFFFPNNSKLFGFKKNSKTNALASVWI